MNYPKAMVKTMYLSQGCIVSGPTKEKIQVMIISLAEYNDLKQASSRSSRGGIKGGAARALSLSPEKRREIAQKGAAARWAKG